MEELSERLLRLYNGDSCCCHCRAVTLARWLPLPLSLVDLSLIQWERIRPQSLPRLLQPQWKDDKNLPCNCGLFAGSDTGPPSAWPRENSAGRC